MLSYKNRHLLKGLEKSDSFSWNPHKSLGAPLQCALFLTRHAELLPQANSTAVHYLFQQDKFYDVSYDTGNKSIQCGRKIDAFKFWIMLKARGYGSFGRLVDHALDMSKLFMEKMKRRQGYRLVMEDYQYTNVCFWYVPKSMRNQKEDEKWWQKLYEVRMRRIKFVNCLMFGLDFPGGAQGKGADDSPRHPHDGLFPAAVSQYWQLFPHGLHLFPGDAGGGIGFHFG